MHPSTPITINDVWRTPFASLHIPFPPNNTILTPTPLPNHNPSPLRQFQTDSIHSNHHPLTATLNPAISPAFIEIHPQPPSPRN
jgi:hypothetical protein